MMHNSRLLEVQSASINSSFLPMESARKLLFLRLLNSVWAILLFYSLINYVIGAKVAFGAVFIGAVVFCPLAWWLERKSFSTLSRFFFIGSCNFYIYTTSLGFAHQISSEYYYLPTAILPFLLFESSKKKEIWGSVLASLLLWVLSLVAGSSFFPHEWLATDVPTTLLKHVNFLGAFTISLIFLSMFMETTVRLKDLLLSQAELEAETLKQTTVKRKLAREELEKAGEALVASENRFRMMFERTADALMLLDPGSGKFIDCNQAAADMLRCPDKKEVLFMHPSRLSPLLQPDGRHSAEKADEMIATAVRNGSHRFEWIHRSDHREDFPVEVLLTPILLGERQMIITTWRDITERKQTEMALSQSQSMMSVILENVSAYIYLMDTNGRYLFANQKLLNLFGATADEVIGFGDEKFLDAKSLEQMRVNDSIVLIDGKTFQGEETVATATGESATYWTVKHPLRHPDGSIYALCGITTDITERKRTEAEVLRINAALLTLTKNTAIDTGERVLAFREICKVTSQVLNVSRVSIAHYDGDREALVYEELYEQSIDSHSSGLILPQKDFPNYFAYLREERVLAAHDAHTNPATAEFSSGYLSPLGISSMLDVPVRFEGKLWGVFCSEHVGPRRTWSAEEQAFGASMADFVIRVLSAEKIQRINASLEIERARAAHNAKLASLGEMSAGVAHEINNPLSIIVGSLSLLTKFKDNPEKFERWANAIEKATSRIEKIVKGLKKFSRSSEGVAHKTEALGDMIKEVLVFTEAKAKRHSTSVTVSAHEGISILCDVVEIEQVIINLVNNGIDAAKNQPEKWVKLNCYLETQHVVLQVMDSGSGISESVELKMFEPFFTTKPVDEGTGLGLSITKGILDDHKAEIKLNRNYANTCFEIRFPKAEAI